MIPNLLIYSRIPITQTHTHRLDASHFKKDSTQGSCILHPWQERVTGLRNRYR